MSQRRTFSILFYLQLLFLVTQAKSISLDFFFRRYINLEHKDTVGDCCTGGTGNCIEDCTSRVKLCLQSAGMYGISCPHGELSFTIFSDNLTFSEDGQIGTSKSMRNISNPVSFQVNPGDYQIYVHVSNAMSNSTILSFRKYVNALDSEVGIMSNAIWSPDKKFQYSYRIGCALTFYGPDCSRVCAQVDDSTGHFKCDSNGETECLPGYTNSSVCIACIPGSQTGTCHELGSTSGVSAGRLAGILVPLLFILACILGGITAGLLWKFKPCASKNPIKTKKEEALNNPIYGCNEDDERALDNPICGCIEDDRLAQNNPIYGCIEDDKRALNNPIYGCIEDDKRALNNPIYGCIEDDKRALNNPIYGGNSDVGCNYAEDQSNPLYSSKENFEEHNTAVMDQSVVVENELLMDILQDEQGDVRPMLSPSLGEGTGVGEDFSNVPRMDPYLSYKDEFLPGIADAGVHQ